jgi:hypothetical protein
MEKIDKLKKQKNRKITKSYVMNGKNLKMKKTLKR